MRREKKVLSILVINFGGNRYLLLTAKIVERSQGLVSFHKKIIIYCNCMQRMSEYFTKKTINYFYYHSVLNK
jgi:hypothetical protein